MRNRPILMLMIMAMFVPELITGSTTLPAFILNPALILIYVIGYGLPALLIRELAIRYEVGLRGMIFFGIAYGILNEGLMAKTLLRQVKLPWPQYDNYGYMLGISIPWAAGICSWHAFASVIFPIYLTHYLCRETSTRPWLTNKAVVAWAIVDLLLASVVYSGGSKTAPKGMAPQYEIMLAAMLVLFLIGLSFKGSDTQREEEAPVAPPSWKPVLVGASILIPFTFVLAGLAAHKANIAVYFAVLIATFYLYGWILKRNRWLASPAFLYFGIGWYLQNGAMSIVYLLGNPIIAAISLVVDTVILTLLWKEIRRSSRPELVPANHDRRCSEPPALSQANNK